MSKSELVYYASAFGGLLVPFFLLHFIVDWGFQSHKTAMAKSSGGLALVLHCFTYTLPFALIFYYLSDPLCASFAFLVIFISHLVEDTYLPVFLWARYVRRPQVNGGPLRTLKDFKDWAGTPLGLILIITIDQLIHLIFLAFAVACVIFHIGEL